MKLWDPEKMAVAKAKAGRDFRVIKYALALLFIFAAYWIGYESGLVATLCR